MDAQSLKQTSFHCQKEQLAKEQVILQLILLLVTNIVCGISLSLRRRVLVILPREVLDDHRICPLIAKASSRLHEVEVSIVPIVP
jgi:hypothetical protein